MTDAYDVWSGSKSCGGVEMSQPRKMSYESVRIGIAVGNNVGIMDAIVEGSGACVRRACKTRRGRVRLATGGVAVRLKWE
jgi:hypothetical protein